MRSLQEIAEGLLDPSLDTSIDHVLDSKVAQDLIVTLKAIKWDPRYEEFNSGSRVYKAKDQDKAVKTLFRAIKKAVKNGEDCKYPYRMPFSKIPDSFIISCMEDKEWPYIVFINPHLPDIYYIMRHFHDDGKVVYLTSMNDRAAKDACIRDALWTGVNNAGSKRNPDSRCTNILIPLPLWEPLKNAITPYT